MRFGSTVLALTCLLGAGCLSPDPQPARPVAASEVAAIEHDDDIELVKLSVAQVSKKFRPEKDGWKKEGTTQMGLQGVEVDLGKVENSTRVELVFGNGSFYKVTFFNGQEQVGTSEASPRIGVMRKKLVVRRVKVPKSAVDKGYDRILVTPRPEKRLSLGSLRVLPPAEAAKWDKGSGKKKPKPAQPKPAVAPTGGKPAVAPSGAKPAPVGARPATPKPAG